MQRFFSTCLAILGWFAVIAQLVLMIQNRVADIPETITRFFSFFTILTNLSLALYFSGRSIYPQKKMFENTSVLTALTLYILIVGLVYQFVLRSVWDPEGLQKVVDELLHSVIPAAALVSWAIFGVRSKINYLSAFKWLIYPGLYLVFILIRGNFSGFYPYPFVHVDEIGMQKVLSNSGTLLLLFLGLGYVFIFLANSIFMTRQIDA